MAGPAWRPARDKSCCHKRGYDAVNAS